MEMVFLLLLMDSKTCHDLPAQGLIIASGMERLRLQPQIGPKLKLMTTL